MSIRDNRKYTKIGHGYIQNATKNLIGMNKTYKRNKGLPINSKNRDRKIILTLVVRGTTDILGKRSGIVCRIAKKVKVEHKTDKGYFKEVLKLSEYGKKKLAKLKREEYERYCKEFGAEISERL